MSYSIPSYSIYLNGLQYGYLQVSDCYGIYIEQNRTAILFHLNYYSFSYIQVGDAIVWLKLRFFIGIY